MERSARIFNCARCHQQVIICSHCDRGNLYCGPSCSKKARQESLRAAGKRYQKTYSGRMNHAKRQQDYRERQNKKVTHRGSPKQDGHDLLFSKDHESQQEDIYCHFCGGPCGSLLRMDFLKTHASGAWPLGP